MLKHSADLSKTIAVVRVATGILFLFFGEYKVAGPGFAHGGFQQYLQGYIGGGAVTFYRPFLAHVVLPYAVFFGYVVGVLEIWIGVSLLLGWWVRPASVAGAFFMLNLALATWWEPGHGVALWRYFGAELDKIPLLFLFLIFYSAAARQPGGKDRGARPRA
jgi:uncharacterized membrane protein YphA (DoxX/SURF4 family)